MASADFHHPCAPPLDDTRAWQGDGPPGVRCVTFAPHTRRIYARPVRVAIGLRISWPPRPPIDRLICASCSSGQSFAFSFLPTASQPQLLFGLELAATNLSRGPHPQVTSRVAFAHRLTAPITALRAVPGAPKKDGPASDDAGPYAFCTGLPVYYRSSPKNSKISSSRMTRIPSSRARLSSSVASGPTPGIR